MNQAGQLRYILLLLFLPSLSHQDCSGVECPLLENCIKEGLESGACCTFCLQKGCRCEGYEKYDCTRAGFKHGTVPEGESYFVDYGSTKCSCPVGGGPISCRYIGCPDMPLNCIEILEPEDGCRQCQRIGCVHNHEKFEAGNSFNIEACRVCHCPNEGGELMCYPVPDCDPQKVYNPKLIFLREGNISHENHTDSNRFDQLLVSLASPSSGKTSPSDNHKTAEYHYNPANVSEIYSDIFALPSYSSTSSNKDESQGTERPETTSSLKGLSIQKKIELRNQDGVHPHMPEKDIIADVSSAAEQVTARLSVSANASWQGDAYTKTPLLQDVNNHNELEYPLHANTSLGSYRAAENNLKNLEENLKRALHHQISNKTGVHHNTSSDGVTAKSSNSEINKFHLKDTGNVPDQKGVLDRLELSLYMLRNKHILDDARSTSHFPELLHAPNGPNGNKWLNDKDKKSTPRTKENSVPQTHIHFKLNSPTQRTPKYLETTMAKSITFTTQSPSEDPPREELKAKGKQEENQGHSQVLFYNPEGGEFSENIMQSCCVAGQRWAREKSHCNQIAGLSDNYSVCSIVEQQCCLSSMKESQCDSGVTAARAGQTCKADVDMSCTDDYQMCCSCCAIGLWMRSEGRGCNIHKYLSYPCGHIFLSCCDTEESQSQMPVWSKENPRPTTQPPRGYPTEKSQVEDLKNSSTKTTATITHRNVITTSPARFHPCADKGSCSQQCMAVAGRAHCSCFPGYLLMTDRRTCKDIDECILRTHNCGEGFVCENTVGSFNCNPKPKCVSGFTQDSQGNCIDINECSSQNKLCTSDFTCINTVGSYSCQRKILRCNQGFHSSSDGTKCVDIDECQMGTHDCEVGQICHNLPGAYRCDCPTGYQYDAFNKVCIDVNECWKYPGRLCAQTCENTPGSYHCSCTTGFFLASDGNNCKDVNECGNNPCSQECVNIYGSYQCYCREGFYLKEDQRTCEDIDECSQSIGNFCAFRCINVMGSYRCACPPHGYITAANGRTCRDIDECSTGTHNCSFSQTCYNLHGTFKCLSFDCPPNYKKVSETHCERISCQTNSIECQNSPLRITYHRLNLKTNIITPAQVFHIGPSPVYSGDNIIINIIKGNEGAYFSARKLNRFTGAIYLQRKVDDPKDFLIDVEMKLLRQGKFTSFLSRIYIFITSN